MRDLTTVFRERLALGDDGFSPADVDLALGFLLGANMPNSAALLLMLARRRWPEYRQEEVDFAQGKA